MAKIKFNGLKRAKITWNSMGKCYSYNVDPGEVIAIAEDQVGHACACGSFVILSSAKMLAKNGPKVNKKTIEATAPIKIVKPLPVVEEQIEEPEEEVMETVIIEVEDEVEEEKVEEEVVKVEEKKLDYTSIRKKELKDMCKESGLHVGGNRDDLIARLVAFDKGIIIDE